MFPFFLGKGLDGGDRAAVGLVFLDAEVVVCFRSDLGEVGDADHLPVFAKLFELLADDGSRFSANVGVDLVKDKGGRLIFFT